MPTSPNGARRRASITMMALVGIGLAVLFIVRVAARLRRSAPTIGTIVIAGALLKIAGPVVFRAVGTDVYEGSFDAAAYSRIAADVAESLRAGVFELSPEQLGGFELLGTGAVIVATAVVFVLLGTNELAAFFIFSALAFWGQCMLFRGFRTALPAGDERWYARLIFLTPSMVFWTSSVGKEAWMVLFLGVTAYGTAIATTRAVRGSWIFIAAGITGLAVVRPHIAVIASVSVGIALLHRRHASGNRRPRSLVRAVVLVVMVLVTINLAQQLLHVDELSTEAVDQAFEDTTQRSVGLGESSFAPPGVNNPLDFPWAGLTVLFRPFPTEADNLPMLLTALESTVILLFALIRFRVITQLPRAARRSQYLMFAALFTVGFVIAFSYIGNFGLLARQRVQVLPFLYVLLASPLRPVGRHRSLAVARSAPST